jgi:DNA-binding beta-propeller fold protein YncE
MRPVNVIAALAALAFACNIGNKADENQPDGDDGPPNVDNPPPPPPPVPSPAVYTRGSLTPLYKLTPRTEYGRLANGGVNMSDSDFVVGGGNFVSAAQKLDEIAAQLAQERGLPAQLNLIANAEDRQRAQQIPFRGNPSDVKFVAINGQTKAFVPLGGDLMTPGNEVAIVTVGRAQQPVRVKVGLRPQRVQIHPSGLVFVCNQYSNYISVIDGRLNQLLVTGDGTPVEIKTEYYCSDLLLVERNPAQNPDAVDLYVANEWRASVLKYGLTIVRDPLNDTAVDVRVTTPAEPNPANRPAAEIRGVGARPYRLSLSEAKDQIYVANIMGGDLSRISVARGTVEKRINLGAPTIDVVQVGDALFVPTTMHDRGLIARDEPVKPLQIQASPLAVTGVDGNQHIAHPGALFDGTRSYNFEDVRNGIFAVNFLLNSALGITYFTDLASSEPNFVAEQKILTGALGEAIIRNQAGTRLFVAHGGSDLVQELEVKNSGFRLSPGALSFRTRERPYALALNEARAELYVASWGGDVLEVFSADTGELLQSIDLGYAVPAYPATTMERGEYLYYNADWSNNGTKSCASCHRHNLLADGVGFSNGATAPTAYHQVPPNSNLLSTDNYFWNGSFANGGYTSLALSAQTRTNCELIVFGMIEGPSSDPATRVGDLNNRVTNRDDAKCRPVGGSAGQLPDNFNDIASVIAAQKLVAASLIQEVTGLTRAEVFRAVDFYSVSELRLAPNPLKHLYDNGELDSETTALIRQGQELFASAGCANCHDPANQRAPFTDNLNHGSGSAWVNTFVNTYFNDPRITEVIGGIPQAMLDATTASPVDKEINVHLDPVDFFVPFCFNATNCLFFEDPLAVRGNQAAESARLDLLVRINLADPERGFVPGNVRGQPTSNTRSLRGLWTQTNLLHNGYAQSVAEAILPPGHSALRAGELGYAVTAGGEIDVHGSTSALTPEQVNALILYTSSIE